MGVWIETLSQHPLPKELLSHTLYGCVDWNKKKARKKWFFACHTLYGCVDWNFALPIDLKNLWCHTLYGCVDWNILCN